jgi:prevent-host-death family protein
MQVNILEAKSQLSRLIKSAQAGEEVIIANRGEPVARIVAIEQQGPAAGAMPARDFVKWLDRHPLPAHAQRTAAELDAAIQSERDAWD